MGRLFRRCGPAGRLPCESAIQGVIIEAVIGTQGALRGPDEVWSNEIWSNERRDDQGRLWQSGRRQRSGRSIDPAGRGA
jgi:hypothetical protein